MESLRYLWKAILFLGIAVVLSAGVPAQAKMVTVNGEKYDIAEPGEFIPNEVVVKLKSGFSKDTIKDLAMQVQGKVKGHIREYDLFLLQLPMILEEEDQKAQVEEAVAVLEHFPQVEAVFPNYKFSIPKPVDQALSNVKDRQYDARATEEMASEIGQVGALGVVEDYQWHLDKVRYYLAGTPPTSAPGIAIIDTGVDYLHPDLSGKVNLGWDYVDNDSDPMDEHGHGTHCAGIAAAKGTYMVRGISPTSRILAVRVLNQYGSGSYFNIVQGVVYARTRVKILSLSLGGYLVEGSSAYNWLKKVFDDTVAMGRVVCVAAGNEADDELFYYAFQTSKYRPVPAWFPSCFTVGATNEVDCRAYFSNYDVGSAGGKTYNFHFVDIVAPGWNILSTFLDGQLQRLSGTSMSCPLVAGAAARVWQKYPSYTRANVESRLTSQGSYVAPHQGFPTSERRVDLMKALGLSQTGFVGIVYDGQTGKPLYYATVRVYDGSTLVKTVYTDRSGMFVVTGLSGGKTYKMYFSRSGFGTRGYSALASTGNMKDIYFPMALPKLQPSGRWSIMISYHSWHPGLIDALYTYPSRPSWYPYNWDEAPGTYFGARLSVPGSGLIDTSHRGSLTQAPYAAMTTDAWDFTNPVTNFVISRVQSGTYKIWTRLDNINDYYYEWGKYKDVSGKNYSRPTAYICYGSAVKGVVYANAATGSGAYWYIGDIVGGTFTMKNVLRTTQP